MKVGILTEGRGEVPALPKLYGQLRALGHQLLNPVFVDVPPLAPAALVANRARARVNMMLARDADRAILILDREGSLQDPVVRAQEIVSALKPMCGGDVRVVIKDRCIENWLIADSAAFSAQPMLFPRHDKIRYAAGRADAQDATKLIKMALHTSSYEKMQHPAKILAHSKIVSMRSNSASFERLIQAITAP